MFGIVRTTAASPPSHAAMRAVGMPAAIDTTSGRCARASGASASQTDAITCGFTASTQVPAPSAAAAASGCTAMPNTPALLGAGATGLFATPRVDAAGRDAAETLMRAAGLTAWIDDEALMDAVTAVSGSGPAYVFLLAEAMQDAGVKQGLPADTARQLASQTLLGAAKMLTELDEPADVLRKKVTSPGGTTQAAIETFESGGLRELVDRAVTAATERGRELSAANDD